jgi:lipopolysaccharide export system protein LptA
MNKIWVIALGVLAFAAGNAQAQISTKNGPIEVNSDHLTADNNANTAIYEGHVEALQNENRMRSDMLNVHFVKRGAGAPTTTAANNGQTASNIDRLEATGNVYFVTPTQVIRGDKAVYTKDNDTIVVTGQVVVTQGEDVMRGSRLTYDRATGKSTMDADPQSGRVKTVLYPDKKTTPAH